MSTRSQLVIRVSRLPPAESPKLNVDHNLPLPAAGRIVLLATLSTKLP